QPLVVFRLAADGQLPAEPSDHAIPGPGRVNVPEDLGDLVPREGGRPETLPFDQSIGEHFVLLSDQSEADIRRHAKADGEQPDYAVNAGLDRFSPGRIDELRSGDHDNAKAHHRREPGGRLPHDFPSENLARSIQSRLMIGVYWSPRR